MGRNRIAIVSGGKFIPLFVNKNDVVLIVNAINDLILIGIV